MGKIAGIRKPFFEKEGSMAFGAIKLLVLGMVMLLQAEPPDPRNIRNGRAIPDEGYCDQPYVVVTQDGAWLCTLTTGPGREGVKGQHVVAAISRDKGRTWSDLIDIEPSEGPEASWVVPLIVPGGRVYAFYTYNGDAVQTLKGKKIRTDMLGWYVYRYSDDNGRTWSKERFRLPMRLTACDRGNDWQGKVQIFWGIDKPCVMNRQVYFAFTKLGRYMLENGEGWIVHSDNLLEEQDPARIHWELLPKGERGIRGERFGSVQEEHNIVPLGNGEGLCCVYRTTRGHPCVSYSPDQGQTWSAPEFMTYTPGGRKIKTPRACPKIWRTHAGRYLFWFHNHGGTTFTGRNPAWITGGVEREGRIHWSQPEILLYDPDPEVRMSYPCLIEEEGRFFVTETNKTEARVHEIDADLLEGILSLDRDKEVARKGLLAERGPAASLTGSLELAEPIDLKRANGLTVELWFRLKDLAPGQRLLDGRDAEGRGVVLTTVEEGAVRIQLSDGSAAASFACDPGLLEAGKLHHAAVIMDARAGIITFVVDGVLCDGGEARTYGWGRIPPGLQDVSGTGALSIAPSLEGEVRLVRIYRRYLRTAEAVSNFRAGLM